MLGRRISWGRPSHRRCAQRQDRLVGWHAPRIAVLLVALALASCTHYVRRAESAYDGGRYLEAAEDLAAHEHELPQLPPYHRAQYGVYRGLSLLELGEVEAAQQWLQYSAEVEQQAPGSLAPYQRMQLDRGLSLIKKLVRKPAAKAMPQAPPLERTPIPVPSSSEPSGGGPGTGSSP